MAKTIFVTPEELNSTAGIIEGLAADYEAQYKQLYSETAAMKAAWDGKDNVAFTDQIAGFRNDLEKMHSLILEYATFLRKSAKMYQDTQDSVVVNARKLAN